MKFEDLVGEYVATGLIVLLSLALAATDLLGIPVFGLLSGMSGTGSAPTPSILSVPGALVFFVFISVAYPVGYTLFRTSLAVLNLFGRQSIYQRGTQILRVQPYCHYMLEVRRKIGSGYAASEDFERDFSLIRMYLFVNHPELFRTISSYWTRLSRMFACYASAFAVAAVVFALCLVATGPLGRPSTMVGRTTYTILALCTIVSFAVSVLAYRLALKREIGTYVSAMQGIWMRDEKISGRVYVFCYGSNMLQARIRERVPSARKHAAAWLDGHELRLNKRGADGTAKANIARRDGCRVHGVIYEIDAGHLGALDREEPNYDRVQLPVTLAGGQALLAEVYIAPPSACDDNLLPFDWYLDLVVAGARENALPPEYVATLTGGPTQPDPNADRRSAHSALHRGPD